MNETTRSPEVERLPESPMPPDRSVGGALPAGTILLELTGRGRLLKVSFAPDVLHADGVRSPTHGTILADPAGSITVYLGTKRSSHTAKGAPRLTLSRRALMFHKTVAAPLYERLRSSGLPGRPVPLRDATTSTVGEEVCFVFPAGTATPADTGPGADATTYPPLQTGAG